MKGTDNFKAGGLLWRHVKELAASGIPRELALRAGIRSVTAEEAEEMVGFPIGPGWAAPYGHPEDSDKVWVVKPDEPYVTSDGRKMKYVWPKGKEPRLFFPPGIVPALNNTKEPLFITEGVKKTLAAAVYGYLVIGVHGVWNFQKDGEEIPDLTTINVRKRIVNIVYDSDAATKESVDLGQFQLAVTLMERGAYVKIVCLPQRSPGEKTGLDDLLASDGKDSFDRLIREATSLVEYEVKRIAALSPEAHTTEISMLLKQVAKRCSPVLQDAFLSAIHERFGTRLPELRRQLQYVARAGYPPIVTKEGLNGIRYGAGIPQTKRFSDVSACILKDLRKNGRFLNSGKGVFYLDNRSGRLLDIAEESFAGICYQQYGTNASNQEWRFVLAEIRSATEAHEPKVTVSEFAYFETKSKTLYVVNKEGSLWKLDGKQITEVPMGHDNVFLRSVDFETPAVEQDPRISWEKRIWSRISLDSEWGISVEQAKLLVKVWTYSIFFSEAMKTRPLLCFVGPKGSGKTTLMKLVGEALLGSRFAVNPMPEQRDDLETLIVNARFVVLDNTDAYISRQVLDLLAMVATGGTISRRKLYSTGELMKLPITCFLAITSHTPQFRHDDIAERLLVLRTARLKKFKSESRLREGNLAVRGGLWFELLRDLNCIVKRLRRKRRYTPVTTHRMADFANFGLVALEKTEHQLWRSALNALPNAQANFMLEKDRVVSALCQWLARQRSEMNEMSATDIHGAISLKSTIVGCSISTLGKRLKDVSDPLRACVRVKFRHLNGRTLYRLELTRLGREHAKKNME